MRRRPLDQLLLAGLVVSLQLGHRWNAVETRSGPHRTGPRRSASIGPPLECGGDTLTRPQIAQVISLQLGHRWNAVETQSVGVAPGAAYEASIGPPLECGGDPSYARATCRRARASIGPPLECGGDSRGCTRTPTSIRSFNWATAGMRWRPRSAALSTRRT